MQKRVLAFLLVMAMVFSLLPVSLVGAEEAAKMADYTMFMQKAHNQTEGSLAIDIYLQASAVSEVTGYQLDVIPAEGLTLTGVADNTGNDNLKASGGTIIYDPAGQKPITVGTVRVLVATVTVTGETLPADLSAALTVNAVVTTQDATANATVKTVATNDCWAEVTGQWKPLTKADVEAAEYKLTDANYYLVEDITTTKQILCSDVNLDLNGYNLAASGNIDLIKAIDGKFLTISDITATGSALDGTLKAGTLVAGNSGYGGGVYAGLAATLKVSNVNLDGSAVVGTDSGNLLYCLAKTDKAAAGKLIVNNVYIFGGKASATSKNVVVMGDARGDMELTDVRFSNFDLTPNPEKTSTNSNALLSARHQTNTGTLVMDNVIADNCNNYAVYMMNADKNRFESLTIKGDTQLADPVYVASGAKLTLDLGKNASITIETEKDLTAEEFGSAVIIPEGATLPTGTLVYKNANLMVDYKDGQFSFSGHSHKEAVYADGTAEGHTVEGMSFNAWNDPAALPVEGNWYLTTDVTLNRSRFEIDYGKVLNLDLNGHTVTQTKSGAGHYSVKGTLNLFDCQGGYDADGNWTGGQLTGGTQQYGGSIGVQRSKGNAAEGETGTFNMYGGRLTGNRSVNGSGGAVYVASSAQNKDSNGAVVSESYGGVFNMYGGEIYNNSSDLIGGAATAHGFSHTATSSTAGVDPAKGKGAQINIHGGKIHGNTAIRAESKSYGEGTINLAYDAIFTMTGGEICNNVAERGGAVFMTNAATKATVTGGKIYGNSAVESQYKRETVTLTKNTSGQVTGHTVYYGSGGAFYCRSGNLVVKNAEIYDNTATVGGAFLINGGAHATIEDCVIDNNVADDKRSAGFATDDVVGTDNKKYTGHDTLWGSGGAFFLDNSNTYVTIKDCKITNNLATETVDVQDNQGAGGAIFAQFIKNLVIDGCTFTGNETAMESGGALFLRQDNTVADVRNSVFTGNKTKVAGAAIYTVNGSILKLTNVDIVNNENTGTTNGAGVYVASSGGRVILSGKVFIAENSNSAGKEGTFRNLYFQSRDDRAKLVEVNELSAGSHVEMYHGSTKCPVYTNDLANGYVQVTSGGTQSDWECGWITVGASGKPEREVAYIDLTDDGDDNKTFEWGHYHKDANGNLIEYVGLSSLPTAAQITEAQGNSADGVARFYLTANVTMNITKATTAYTVPGTFTLCLNSKVVSSNVRTITSTNASHVMTLEDCTAAYAADGTYTAGGITSTAATTSFGAGMRIEAGEIVMNAGKIFGTKYSGSGSTGGNAVYIKGTGKFTMNGGEICDNHVTTSNAGTQVGVLQVQDSGVAVLKNGAIRNNSVTATASSVVASGKTSATMVNVAGAAIYHGGKATLTIDNFLFENNVATATGNGSIAATGVIYEDCTGKTTITNTVFRNNKAETTGAKKTHLAGEGGLTKDTSYSPMTRGALFLQGTHTVELTNVDFIGNQSISKTDARGGAIFSYAYNSTASVTTAVTLKATNCTFEDNATSAPSHYAGAVYLANKTAATFTGCTFENNTSKNGGVSYSANSAVNVDWINCTFKENKATNAGGALFMQYYNALNIKGCTFDGNEATGEGKGGALNIQGNAGKLATIGGAGDEGNTFINNKSSAAGSAIYFYSNSDSKIINCAFNKNTSGGGTIYYTGDGNSTIDGCTFTENVSTAPVSAIRVEGTKDVILKDTTVTGNEAKSHGAVFAATKSSTLALQGKVIITDNISWDRANDSADLFFQDKPDNQAHVDASGLTAGSKIGLNTYDARPASDPVLTTGGSAAVKDYFFVNEPDRFIMIEKDGELALVKYVDAAGNAYGTVQAALEAAEAANAETFQLQTSTTEELTLTSIDYIDLAGHDIKKIIVPDALTLTVIDSATNDYDCEDGYGQVTIQGKFNTYVEDQTTGSLKRYVTVTHSTTDATDTDPATATISAHRVYLAINYKTLRPEKYGVGFKAIFAGDQVVAESGIIYGIELSGYADFNQVWKAGFDTMEAGAATKTPNQKNVIITQAISAQDTSRYEDDLYGRPFITIGDTTVYGKTVTVNMKEMAENALKSGDEAIAAAVLAMIDSCFPAAN